MSYRRALEEIRARRRGIEQDIKWWESREPLASDGQEVPLELSHLRTMAAEYDHVIRELEGAGR